MFPQLHVLPPVRQEVCDPPAGGVGHTELGELVERKRKLSCLMICVKTNIIAGAKLLLYVRNLKGLRPPGPSTDMRASALGKF